MSLTLHAHPWLLSVVKLAAMPPAMPPGKFVSLTVSPSEYSLVCEAGQEPANAARIEHGWRCMEIVGPLDFSMVGVLAKLSTVLADKGISIVAISSFDTDYILVRDAKWNEAITALSDAGYRWGQV